MHAVNQALGFIKDISEGF